MPVRHLARRLLLLSLAASMGSAQQTPAPTNPSSAASSVIASAEAATSTNVPLALWSAANSLLTSYYPSTSLDGVATLSWPATVVIAGSTYHPQSLSDAIATPTSASTRQALASASATPTDAAGTDEPKDSSLIKGLDDKKLGIILGSVFGLVALILLGVVFWCLKRRKDDTGSFFMRRRTPSIASSDIRSWMPRSRPDTFGNTSYISAGPSHPDPWDKRPQIAVRPQMTEPRMSQHPAYAVARQYDSSRSTSEDNPFYTPAERLDAQLGQDADLERGAYYAHPVELDDNERRRSSTSLRASGDRPPTPFSPMEMMGFGAARTAPSTQVERRDFGQNPAQGQQMNPFASPEDEENDIVSPILPSRSPERRHSPMVHYPSWSEVSEFDFRGDGSSGLRNTSSTETDGGDGWQPNRDRKEGRYELA